MTAPTEDLIARLENHRVILKSGDYDGADLMRAWCTMSDAAQALRSLQAEVGRLRGALQYYAGGQVNPNEGPWGVNSNDFGDIARSALTGSAQG